MNGKVAILFFQKLLQIGDTRESWRYSLTFELLCFKFNDSSENGGDYATLGYWRAREDWSNWFRSDRVGSVDESFPIHSLRNCFYC